MTDSKLFNQHFEEYDKVHQHKRKQASELISLLTEKIQCEADYAKALQKLSNFKLNYLLQRQAFISSVSPLVDVAESIISNAENKYSQICEYIDSVKEECVQSLDELLKEQKKLNQHYYQEGKNITRQIMDSGHKLEQIRDSFFQSSYEANTLMKEYEEAKHIRDFSKMKKDQIFRQMNQIMRESENKEMLYRQQIKQSNNYKDHCMQQLESVIKNYENLETELYQTQLDSIAKLNIFETSMTRNIQYDTKDVASLTENLTAEEELKFQREQEYYKRIIKFQDYQFKTLEEENEFVQNGEIEKPKKEIQTLSPSNQDILKTIVTDIFKAKDVQKQQLDQFNQLMTKKEGRNEFCTILKQITGAAQSKSIDQKTYVNICYLFTVTLSEIHKQQDTSQILQLIEYSQAFYTLALGNSKQQNQLAMTPISRPRNYISNGINKHLVWLDYDFWEKIIFDYLREETRRYNQTIETESRWDEQADYEIRVRQIIFQYLSSIQQDMLTFEVPKKKVKEIIHHFCSVHSLTRDQISQLMHKIDSFESNAGIKTMSQLSMAAQPVKGVPDWLQQLEDYVRNDIPQFLKNTMRPSQSFAIGDILSTRNSDITTASKGFDNGGSQKNVNSQINNHSTFGNVFNAFTMNSKQQWMKLIEQKKPGQIQRSPSQSLNPKQHDTSVHHISVGKSSFKGEASPGAKMSGSGGSGGKNSSGGKKSSFIRTEEITFEEESATPGQLMMKSHSSNSNKGSMKKDMSVNDQVIQ